MNDQINQKGLDIAQSLYDNSPGVFQVRNQHGSKIAEFESKAETKAFLREKEQNQYEVWQLEQEPPSDIKGIYPGADFINQQ